MKRLKIELLFLSLLFCALYATPESLALPSAGFSALQNQAKMSSVTSQGQMHDKVNGAAKAESAAEQYQKSNFKTQPGEYGKSDQAGVQDNGGHKVETKAPENQSQEVKDQQVKKEQKPCSYFNQGGKNKAVWGIHPDKPWYVLPARTESTTPPSAATKSMIESNTPQLPATMNSGLATNQGFMIGVQTAALNAAQLINSPKRQYQNAKSNMAAQQQEVSDATAGAAETGFNTGVEEVRTSLINVANEGAGTPTGAEAATKTHSQAIWMVQQMYKAIYIPMALLLLLPGAVMTNLKGYLAFGMLGLSNDEDAVSPFSGILRSIIAIFLIPATQLFASWSIDVGNAMTYEVSNYIEPTALIQWMQEQTYNAPMANAKNQLSMPKDLQMEATRGMEAAMGGGAADNIAGKVDGGGEGKSQVEQQGSGTRMLQMAFNMLNVAMNFGMLMLSAFQMVMICYLFLMGPLAAAFFAWPAGVGSLFKTVFANWIDALISVSLWKFWWCVVILIMQTRIEWLQEQGIYIPNSQWEMAVYTAFMVILLYVPFVPFDYKPGEMVTKILEKAEDLKSEAVKGAGSGKGKGNSGGNKGGGRPSTPGNV
jgi:hypothetical protein